MKISAKLLTNGRGLWSCATRCVTVYAMDTDRCDDEFGELCVFFHKRSWDIRKHGLIYTDPMWIREFRTYLRTLGFSKAAVQDVDYSEQGMQGSNYVSLDVGEKFLTEWDD